MGQAFDYFFYQRSNNNTNVIHTIRVVYVYCLHVSKCWTRRPASRDLGGVARISDECVVGERRARSGCAGWANGRVVPPSCSCVARAGGAGAKVVRARCGRCSRRPRAFERRPCVPPATFPRLGCVRGPGGVSAAAVAAASLGARHLGARNVSLAEVCRCAAAGARARARGSGNRPLLCGLGRAQFPPCYRRPSARAGRGGWAPTVLSAEPRKTHGLALGPGVAACRWRSAGAFASPRGPSSGRA